MNPFVRWISILFQIALGVIFLAACYHKIVDPPTFAKQVYEYRITPGGLINLIAIYLPWIELVAGVCLVVGVWTRGATGLVGVMLLVFTAALSFNLWRGHPVDCACFSVGPPRSGAELLAEMRVRIAQDVGMLLMVAAVLVIGRVFGEVSRPWLPGWRRRGASDAVPAAAE